MSTLLLNAKEVNEMQLPGMVRNYVKSNYPDAENKKWDFDEKKKTYEVNFKEGGREINLELSYTGLVLNGNEQINLSDTPQFIHNYINENYTSPIIINVYRKVDSKGMKYDAYISYTKGDDIKYKHIVFDEDGKVIKQY